MTVAEGVDEGRELFHERLNERVAELNALMKTHAGAIEVVDVTSDGVLTVRFVAMCQGCPFRAVTLYGLIKPGLEELPGVSEVRALGVRVSEEAAERAVLAIGEDSAWLPLAARNRDLDRNGGER
jgi:Fe-S cluster biogenesis protein NfuA